MSLAVVPGLGLAAVIVADNYYLCVFVSGQLATPSSSTAARSLLSPCPRLDRPKMFMLACLVFAATRAPPGAVCRGENPGSLKDAIADPYICLYSFPFLWWARRPSPEGLRPTVVENALRV